MAKKVQIRSEYRPATVLRSWRALVANIKDMNEDELEAALRTELFEQKRKDVLLRLRRRQITLKAQNALKELQ